MAAYRRVVGAAVGGDGGYRRGYEEPRQVASLAAAAQLLLSPLLENRRKVRRR